MCHNPTYKGLPSDPYFAHADGYWSLARLITKQSRLLQMKGEFLLGEFYGSAWFGLPPPQPSAQTIRCCSLTEASPQVPYRIWLQNQLSHVLVGAAAQVDMAHPNPNTFLGVLQPSPTRHASGSSFGTSSRLQAMLHCLTQFFHHG